MKPVVSGASNRKNGIAFYDTSDPAHPRLVSEYTATVTGGVHSAFVDGHYVYLTDDATGSMRVIDFCDVKNPKEVARWQVENQVATTVRTPCLLSMRAVEATKAAQSVSVQKLTVGRPVVPLVHRLTLSSRRVSLGSSAAGGVALSSSFVKIGTLARSARLSILPSSMAAFEKRSPQKGTLARMKAICWRTASSSHASRTSGTMLSRVGSSSLIEHLLLKWLNP
jgi:hypothetical protein